MKEKSTKLLSRDNSSFNLQVSRGFPLPLGVTHHPQGINFSFFSKNATHATLLLFLGDSSTPSYEIDFDPALHHTGDLWHLSIEGLPRLEEEKIQYSYRLSGPFSPEKGHYFDKTETLLDPYAHAICSPFRWGESENYSPRGELLPSDSFDWESDRHPNIPLKDIILYEMHVRGFTQDKSSQTQNPGSFLGVIEKIPHLLDLGINAIELLPVHEFNEREYPCKNPFTGEQLTNYWGYSTVNFFSPMNRYSVGNSARESINAFKTMVRELHKAGIEVFLDVVFNHTAEGNEKGPTLSFRGFENSTYYMLSPDNQFHNFSGCGNTMNCNHPIVREMIHNCLRYWVTEMHVDGFRFDLASILGRAPDGTPLENPPLIEQIALDPLLSKTKLIAEAWDAGGLYQVGSFPASEVWAEWNGIYRDTVRNFLRGNCSSGEFATRLSGSEDLYRASARKPFHSINFITCHDGFTLRDLVSYNEKHNLANGEDNRDGSNNNLSWNCGVEGESDDPAILQLRQQQMRNFHMALMLSQGVPMLLMGDEYGHTRYGNNNAWCQDNEINWFLWDRLIKDKSFYRFFKKLIHFRKKHPQLRRENFLTEQEVVWHGPLPNMQEWHSTDPFIAFTLKELKRDEELYIAFHPSPEEVRITLPEGGWKRLVDTALPSPEDFVDEEEASIIKKNNYLMKGYSSLLLKKG